MTPCPITADRDAWRGAVTEREAELVSALEGLLAVASHGSPRADDRVKQWASAMLKARSVLARAHTAAEGGE